MVYTYNFIEILYLFVFVIELLKYNNYISYYV